MIFFFYKIEKNVVSYNFANSTIRVCLGFTIIKTNKKYKSTVYFVINIQTPQINKTKIQ